jgi:hypothetical protein
MCAIRDFRLVAIFWCILVPTQGRSLISAIPAMRISYSTETRYGTVVPTLAQSVINVRYARSSFQIKGILFDIDEHMQSPFTNMCPGRFPTTWKEHCYQRWRDTS